MFIWMNEKTTFAVYAALESEPKGTVRESMMLALLVIAYGTTDGEALALTEGADFDLLKDDYRSSNRYNVTGLKTATIWQLANSFIC